MQCHLLDDGDARDPTSLALWTQLVNLCLGVGCREHCMSDVVDVCTKDLLFSHLETNIYVQLFCKILHMQVKVQTLTSLILLHTLLSPS